MKKSLDNETGLAKLASYSLQLLIMVAFSALIIFGLSKISFIVLAFAFALILSSSLFPLISFLEGKRINRAAGSLLVISLLLAILGGMVYFIFNSFLSNWEFLQTSVKNFYDQLIQKVQSEDFFLPREYTDPLLQSVGQSMQPAILGEIFQYLGKGVVLGVTGTFLTLVLLGFFLKDGSLIFEFIVSMFPERLREKVRESGKDAIQTLGGYVTGTTIIAAINSVLIGLCLGIMHVPLALPLALLVFLGVFIPYVGGTTTGIIVSLMAFATTSFESGITVCIVVMAVNQFEGYVLAPYILGKKLKMHPLVVLLTLTTGAILGGIAGTLLAVPLAVTAWSIRKTWTNSSQINNPPAG